MDQVNENINKAQQEQEELKVKGKEFRENNLIDFSSIEVNNNTEKEKKLQKQILQRIKKERYRNHTFKFLTKHISRGVNRLLKRVHVVNKEGEITKTYLKKEEIEDTIHTKN